MTLSLGLWGEGNRETDALAVKTHGYAPEKSHNHMFFDRAILLIREPFGALKVGRSRIVSCSQWFIIYKHRIY